MNLIFTLRFDIVNLTPHANKPEAALKNHKSGLKKIRISFPIFALSFKGSKACRRL